MRVLHVIPDLAVESGGPVSAVLGLTEEQVSLGCKVSVAATDYGVKTISEQNGVSIDLFPFYSSSLRWTPALSHFLTRNLSNYDILHIHSIWQCPSWIAARACWNSGMPYLVTPHGSLDTWALSQKSWKKWPHLALMGKRILRLASALHGTSVREVENFQIRKWNSSPFLLPYGLPKYAYDNLPEPTTFFDQYPELSNKRIVLFLGRLHYKKRPEVAIRAFQAACHDKKDVCLVIAGPGDFNYLESLRNLARELRIDDRVIFLGTLRGRAVQEAFRAATLFILPSWHENFGIAVAEAMAAECPVIISDCVDLAPEVRHAEGGLVTTLSVESNAEAIATLLRDEPLRRQMGQNGRRLVLERFTWEKISQELDGIYQDILDGHRRSDAWAA